MSDNIYLNAVVINGQLSQTSTLPVAAYGEQRTSNIVDRASDYECAVARMLLSGATTQLPIFEASVQLGQSNPNQLAYRVSLQYQWTGTAGPGGATTSPVFTSTRNVQWVPQYSAPVPPTGAAITSQSTSRYYWAHSYAHVARIFNTAFAACRADLLAQFTTWWGATPAFPGIVIASPQIQYVSDGSNTFTLLRQANSATETMRVWFDSNAFNLWSSFPYKSVQGAEPLFAELDDISNTVIQLPNTATGAGTGPFYMVIRQEWASTEAHWSPFTGIALRSAALPVRTESGGIVSPGQQITGNLYDSVFFDIDFASTAAHSSCGEISFQPSVYRWATLKGNGPITSLDFVVLLRHRTGQLVPLEQAGTWSNVLVKLVLRSVN